MEDAVHERITWEPAAQDNFQKVLGQIPEMLRGIAEIRVTKKAEELVRQSGRRVIEEKDMVDALFMETPGGFLGPMKAGMEEIGIDYTRYGHT